MAQTTGAVVFTGALIEYTIDGGTTYTDISGFGKVVTVEGGERNRGEYFTADGDTPILKAGKRTKQTVTVDAVYTVTLTDPYKVIRDIHITAGGGTTTTIPMIRFSLFSMVERDSVSSPRRPTTFLPRALRAR